VVAAGALKSTTTKESSPLLEESNEPSRGRLTPLTRLSERFSGCNQKSQSGAKDREKARIRSRNED